MKILNFGSANIDLVYSVDAIVREGETVESTRMDTFPGGKGLNQAVALAKAGGDVWFAGNIGRDGLMLKTLLEESGVQTEFLRVVDEKTGHAVIQVDRAGRNCILISHGANFCNDDNYIDAVLSYFAAGDFLILQNEINGLPALVDRAYARGMRIVLNPSPINAAIEEADLSKLAYLILNETEAKAIAGSDDLREFFPTMRARYPALKLVLTLGGDGSCYDDGTRRLSCPIHPVKAVDTTAAGDTYTGFFFASLAAGKDAGEAMRIASIAAGLAVSRKGAAVSIPDLAEVERCLPAL